MIAGRDQRAGGDLQRGRPMVLLIGNHPIAPDAVHRAGRHLIQVVIPPTSLNVAAAQDPHTHQTGVPAKSPTSDLQGVPKGVVLCHTDNQKTKS